ncbi:MAG: CoA transferase, partial [Acidimicrobiia bacterium]
AVDHPHIKARKTVVNEYGLDQPAPAPRFSRTPGTIQGPPAWPGQHTDEVLADWGFAPADVAKLRETGAIK